MCCYSVLKCSRRSSLAGVPISGRVSPLAHHLAHVIRLAREFGHPPDSLALEVEEAMGSAARHLRKVTMTYTGRGAHARARKAIRVEAQLTPRFLYMGVTKSGKLGVSEVVFLNQAGQLTRHRRGIAAQSSQRERKRRTGGMSR